MTKLKRDAKGIQSLIYIKDGKYYCKEKCTIEYPAWYEDRSLGEQGEEIKYYGIAAIIVGERYCVSVVPTLCSSSPVSVSEIERDGTVYKQLNFGKDDPIINNINVVKHTLKSYEFFEGFFMRARIPWFMEYEDIVKSLDNLVKYGGSNVGGSLIANEILTSFITRPVKDKSSYYRQVGGDYVYVDLMNVYHSAIGTVNKLAGNYFSNAITSTLVQENTGETKLERHMKG